MTKGEAMPSNTPEALAAALRRYADEIEGEIVKWGLPVGCDTDCACPVMREAADYLASLATAQPSAEPEGEASDEITCATLAKAIGCKALSLMQIIEPAPTLNQPLYADQVAAILAALSSVKEEQREVELPDDGELEAWRQSATDLRGHTPGRALQTKAAHLLENAYLFARKLRDTAPAPAVSAPQPLTAQQMKDELCTYDPHWRPSIASFTKGVRFAERAHGIGPCATGGANG